jgi:tRNA threonylcarbamoyladenosine biosynthesis protein TsaE
MLEGTRRIESEAAMRALGAALAKELSVGDAVMLEGPLGAGKTTLVRGLVESLGYSEPVRSPTFNLIQVFDTSPPVVHADLYRLKSYSGIGLEDYLSTHVCLIEWADRAAGLVEDSEAWHVHLEIDGNARIVTITAPTG